MLSNIRKNQAIKYRKNGFSLSEIADKIHISKSTASLWLHSIQLPQKAKRRLLHRRDIGKKHAIQTINNKKQSSYAQAQEEANKILNNASLTNGIKQILLSFLLWTEGGKSADRYISFINSDPLMISTFLILLRQTYHIDERKLRALVHMHEYHNETHILAFWKKTTGIPLSQFSKTYHKPHTKKRIREGYQGCIRIRYYNAYIVRELRALYNTFAHQLGT